MAQAQPRRRGFQPFDWTPITSRNYTNALTNPQIFSAEQRALGDLVLNNKKDIKFSSAAASIARAPAFARKKGLKEVITDINEDHVDDIVLYNKQGQPVYINGYFMHPSEHKLRQQFDTSFPQHVDKIRIGGYSGYKKGFWTNPDNADAANAFATANRDTPYYVPPQPAERRVLNNLYQRWSKIAVPYFAEAVRSYLQTLAPNKSHLASLVPPMSIASYYFVKSVLAHFWNNVLASSEEYAAVKTDILTHNTTPALCHNAVKRYIKQHKDEINNIFTDEFITNSLIPLIDAAELSSFFNEIEFTREYLNDAPTDTQIKRDSNLRANKVDEKERFGLNIDSVKDNLIGELFVPPLGWNEQ